MAAGFQGRDLAAPPARQRRATFLPRHPLATLLLASHVSVAVGTGEDSPGWFPPDNILQGLEAQQQQWGSPLVEDFSPEVRQAWDRLEGCWAGTVEHVGGICSADPDGPSATSIAPLVCCSEDAEPAVLNFSTRFFTTPGTGVPIYEVRVDGQRYWPRESGRVLDVHPQSAHSTLPVTLMEANPIRLDILAPEEGGGVSISFPGPLSTPDGVGLTRQFMVPEGSTSQICVHGEVTEGGDDGRDELVLTESRTWAIVPNMQGQSSYAGTLWNCPAVVGSIPVPGDFGRAPVIADGKRCPKSGSWAVPPLRQATPEMATRLIARLRRVPDAFCFCHCDPNATRTVVIHKSEVGEGNPEALEGSWWPPSGEKGTLLFIIGFATLGLLLLCCLGAIVIKKAMSVRNENGRKQQPRRKQQPKLDKMGDPESMQGNSLTQYTEEVFQELNLTEVIACGLAEHWLIPSEHVRLMPVAAASGGFGEVRRGSMLGNTDVAVKIPRRKERQMQSTAQAEALANEMRLFRRVRHPNIVLFHGVTVLGDQGMPLLCLVLEWIAGGDFGQYVKSRRKNGEFDRECREKQNQQVKENPSSYVREHKIMLDVARGMQYLHGQQPIILHLDLKPGNVLIESDVDPPRGKIADFGLSVLLQPEEDHSRRAGTQGYMAPEVAERRPYNAPADVYSFGGIGYYALCLKHPDKDPRKTCLELASDRLLPAGVATVSAQCLQEEPHMRPDFSTIYQQLTNSNEATASTTGTGGNTSGSQQNHEGSGSTPLPHNGDRAAL